MGRIGLITLLLILFTSIGYSPTGYDQVGDVYLVREASGVIKSILADSLNGIHDTLEHPKWVAHYYEANKYHSIWMHDDAKLARSFIKQLSNSLHYGLIPGCYPIEHLKDYTRRLETEREAFRLAEFDILMTHTILQFLSHLRYGMIKTIASDSLLLADQELISGLQQIKRPEDIEPFLEAIQPQFFHYRQMQNNLTNLLSESDLFNWDFDLLVLNQTTLKVQRQLLHALRFTGFFQGDIEAAVNDFSFVLTTYQQSKGLPATGRINLFTLYQLENDAGLAFQKVALNLDRLRANPLEGDDYIWINIPGFRLAVIEAGRPLFYSKVIVGTPYRQTPELSTRISTITTYPEWYVPRRIAWYEILPSVRKNPSYLDRKNYYLIDRDGDVVDHNEVDLEGYSYRDFPYRVIQSSGTWNALGKVKFSIPNTKYIFLHDTNAPKLFNKEVRTFSHGCIRLQNPVKVAEYVLNEEEEMEFHENMEVQYPCYIRLQRKIRLYTRYITCEADSELQFNFYDDVYKKDGEYLPFFKPQLSIR
ncbi:hypothetical protein DMA11_04795 [Marinilabiliaceae bacterium JC017]|nr:hypothetical protein DMA11_04795 [Marinilabiliaceae bacterium JC017]